MRYPLRMVLLAGRYEASSAKQTKNVPNARGSNTVRACLFKQYLSFSSFLICRRHVFYVSSPQ